MRRPSDEGVASEASPRRTLTELAVGYGLILIVVWTPVPAQRFFYWAAIVWIAAVTWLSHPGPGALGLRLAGFVRSSWVVGAALLLAGVAGAISIHLRAFHAPPGPLRFFERFGGYILWSFVQQFLLQGFMLLRLLRILPSRGAAVGVAAALFALAHVPNPILTAVTALWGLAACALFLAYRNLFTLAIAHALMGITIAVAIPGPVHHNMRVGLGYLTYRPRRSAQRSQSDHATSTRQWVTAEAPTRALLRQARP